MKKSVWIFIFALGLSCASLLANATPPANYRAVIPVKIKTVEARKQAFSQALLQVLQRLTGNASLQQESLAALEKPVVSMVSQFNYKHEANYKDATKSNASVEDAPSYSLEIEFSGQSIKQVLLDLQQQVWVEPRPSLLIWLASKTDAGDVLVDADDSKASILRGQAAALGLNVVFPVLDIEELRDINFSEIWQGNTNKLQDLSLRYQPQAILIGRIEQLGEQWQADWQFINGAKHDYWHDKPSILANLLGSTSKVVVEQLRQQFTKQLQQQQQQESTELQVSNVSSAADYELVQKYLQELDAVRDLDVVSVKQGQVVYKIHLTSSIAALTDAIAANNILLAAKAASKGELAEYRLFS